MARPFNPYFYVYRFGPSERVDRKRRRYVPVYRLVRVKVLVDELDLELRSTLPKLMRRDPDGRQVTLVVVGADGKELAPSYPAKLSYLQRYYARTPQGAKRKARIEQRLREADERKAFKDKLGHFRAMRRALTKANPLTDTLHSS